MQRKTKPDYPPFRTLIQGVSASGKTYLLKQILNTQLRGKFDDIWCICPTHEGQEIWQSIHLKKDHKIKHATNEEFDKLMEKVDENRKNDKESLIILDDWLYQELAKNGSSLCNNILHLRHKWCSIIILSQYYKAVPPCIRTNMNKVIVFKNDSESEVRKMQEDYGDQWRSHYEEYTKNKYGYVFSDFDKSIYDGRYSSQYEF